MLFVMNLDNFVVAIFNRPKKRNMPLKGEPSALSFPNRCYRQIETCFKYNFVEIQLAKYNYKIQLRIS